MLAEQWRGLLEINCWPIFAVALHSLRKAPAYWAALAPGTSRMAAGKVAEGGVIRRHDIAGRIFRRLLDARKFLATNYTTIPAAVILAGLAPDRKHPRWDRTDWDDSASVGSLRIVDPACGSGTLLMAVVQDVPKRHRHADGSGDTQGPVIKALLESALYGFDVVPAAVHLAAATLSMSETKQAISHMPIFWMPHDVREGRPRLRSLDFLPTSPGKGKAQFMQLFPDHEADPGRMSGTGEWIHDAFMPEECDLVIANPPYKRAGGPGSAENTDWNPLFGSVLSESDAGLMRQALKKTLGPTSGSLYAGLGSAFLVLGHERLRVGGRLAFVLPATALTGSLWGPIRKLLLDHYRIDWVVVSHDPRNRSARRNLPGRRFVAFSESTRIAETLIVATRTPPSAGRDGMVRFVNLRRNPDEPIDALGVTRALLASRERGSSAQSAEITLGSSVWGETRFVQQGELDARPWPHVAFVRSRLTEVALDLRSSGELRVDFKRVSLSIRTLREICELGPYEMQIKNPSSGLFSIVETEDPTRSGHPAS